MDFLKARPFQIIFIAGFILVAFLSLFIFATFQGHGPKGAKIGTVTIWGVLPQSAISSVLSSYTASHQDYARVSYVEKHSETFDADLANALASGSGPDLVLISQEQLATERNKLTVIPYKLISQRTYQSSYVPEVALFQTSTGSYGIPLAVDPLVLYYNRDKLASAGAANPPATWEAITGLAPTLSQHTVADITQSAIAMGEYSNVTNARGILSLLFLQAGSTLTQAGQDGTYHSTLAQVPTGAQFTAGQSPAESALAFYTQFADPQKTVYSWNRQQPDARQEFLAGQSALYIGYASEEPLLAQSNPNLNFDMAPIPQPQTAATKTTFGLAYVFAIPKASKNGAGALSASMALTVQGPAVAFAHALSMAPVLRSALTPSTSDLYQPVYYPEALYAKGWLSPAPSVTDGIFSTMITDMRSGRLSPAEAIQKADQAIGSAI